MCSHVAEDKGLNTLYNQMAENKGLRTQCTFRWLKLKKKKKKREIKRVNFHVKSCAWKQQGEWLSSDMVKNKGVNDFMHFKAVENKGFMILCTIKCSWKEMVNDYAQLRWLKTKG